MTRDLAADDLFETAFSKATSWRDLYRRLGFTASPGPNANDRMRSQATRLGLDAFASRPGTKRSWSDQELSAAVAQSVSWRQVEKSLGAGHSSVRAAARELGLDTDRLDQRDHLRPPSPSPVAFTRTPERLHVAAEHLAFSWYSLHGRDVYTPSAGMHLVDLLTLVNGG